MDKLLTVGQSVALNHVLTEYPMDKPFQQIMHLINEGSEDVIVQDNFTAWHEVSLYDFITDLAIDIDQKVASTLYKFLNDLANVNA